MDHIYELQADVLKALASPRRLEIIHQLGEGPCDVGTLAAKMGVAQPSISQHLAVMRSAGIVIAERVGRAMRYRLSDPDVVTACELMRGVLRRRLARMSAISGLDARSRSAPVPLPVNR